ncbi:MAG: 30S ribosomal protein S13 [Thermoplasmata archaeon]|nr:MAG: 30S ribosomal protein S13 [Thermoplasmata archaeon]
MEPEPEPEPEQKEADEPGKPGEPGEPAEPAKPSEPVKPVEPSEPPEPLEPSEPPEPKPVKDSQEPVEPERDKAVVKPEKPAAPKKKPSGPREEKPEEEDEDFKYIVRIANTDLDGHKTVEWGLTGITGIGSRLAVILADSAGIPRDIKMGKLTDEQVEVLEKRVKEIPDIMPPWLTNRQKDSISGDDTHIFGPDIQLVWRDDVNRLKMIRCYRGIRHEQGQKVRGQRTRANGRSGVTVGVVKKAVRQKQAADKKK